MASVVDYPVELTGYQVSISRDAAHIVLDGTEEKNGAQKRVASITFSDHNNGELINRGGWLQMYRSIEMLPAILDLLRNEKPLFLTGEGVISSEREPVGEAEG